MKKITQTYLKIINEDLTRLYYKNSFIDFSFLTEDDHFLKRVNDRSRNPYSEDQILKIIHDGIDSFIEDNRYKIYRDNPGQKNAKLFSIISKSHDKIKIKVMLWKNSKKEKADAILYDKPIVDYMCRLKTILTNDMYDYKNDVPIIVENNEDEILIYVN